MKESLAESQVVHRRGWIHYLLRTLACLCLLGSLLQPVGRAEIISVGPSGDYVTIQEALDASETGDEIIVEQGIYQENLLFPGLAIVVRSSDPTDPVVVAQTIIDGGSTGSVVTFDGQETPACLLAGFTVTNGQADSGGGINAQGSEATIENNLITGNRASYTSTAPESGRGGGIWRSNGTIRYNRIIGNIAQIRGGGLCECNRIVEHNLIADNYGKYGGGIAAIDASDINGTIRYNTITRNRNGDRGGGIYECQALIEHNTILDNSVIGSGGGLAECHRTIQYNTIWRNEIEEGVSGGGGGLYGCGDWEHTSTIRENTIWLNSARTGGGITMSSATIEGNWIIENSAMSGAGIGGCNGTVRNNIVARNSADLGFGGGLYGGSGDFYNNTVYGNTAGSGGGGLYMLDGNITNCVIWGNVGGQVVRTNEPGYSVDYSCIESWGSAGTGNITLAPDLSDPLNYEWHLNSGSPGIDAGNPSSQWNDACLPPGLDGERNDIGAYGGPDNCTMADNEAETITLLKPPAEGVRASGAYRITWEDSDGDDDAVISLFYDTIGQGHQGTPIAGGLSEDDETDAYTWVLDDMPDGTYYVYAIIDDGHGLPVVRYAPGPLTIGENEPPSIAVLTPPAENAASNDTYEITWTDEDLDDDAEISLYYDGDNEGYDGINIITGLSEDDETDAYTWDLMNVPAAAYYVYAKIDDGVNPPVYSYAPGTLTVEGPPLEDSDGDGMPDEWEEAHGFDVTTDDASSDPDGDGLTALEEFSLHLDPRDPDSDGDGYSDGHEVDVASQPLDSADTPLARSIDSDGSGAVDAVDVQFTINAALGLDVVYLCDFDRSGTVDAIDVQLAINSALGILVDLNFNRTLAPEHGALATNVEISTLSRCVVVVEVDELGATTIEHDGVPYHNLLVQGTDRTYEPGRPSIPVVTFQFAVPTDSETGMPADWSVQVETQETNTYERMWPTPVQLPMWADDPTQTPVEERIEPPFTVDHQLYASPDPYPDVRYTAQFSHIGTLDVLTVRLHVAEYLSGLRTLRLCNRTRVEINFDAGHELQEPVVLGDFTGTGDPGDEMLADGMVNNDRVAVLDYSNMFEELPPIDRETVADEPFELLIIVPPASTPPSDDFYPAALRLARHRQDCGVRVLLASPPDIFFADADTLRDWIIMMDEDNVVHYSVSGTTVDLPAMKAILLFGDTPAIPTFYGVNDRLDPDPTAPGDTTLLVSTDNYYANIRGSADDPLPDVAVGRISVDTVAEAETVVDKIIQRDTMGDTAKPDGVALHAFFQDDPHVYTTLTGRCRFVVGNPRVVGTGTLFEDELFVDTDYIFIRPVPPPDGNDAWYFVDDVIDNMNLDLNRNFRWDPLTAGTGMSATTQAGWRDGEDDWEFVRSAERIRFFYEGRGVDVHWHYLRDPLGPEPRFEFGGRPLTPEEAAHTWDNNVRAIQARWEQGVDGFIVYCGHGQRYGWWCPEFYHYPWGSTPHTDLVRFTHPTTAWYPILFTMSCSSGWFDNEVDVSKDFRGNPIPFGDTAAFEESFCESVLRFVDGGAAAAIGSCRMSNAEQNSYMLEGLWSHMYGPAYVDERGVAGGRISTRLGSLFRNAKLYQANRIGSDGYWYRYNMEIYNLFGDPMMPVLAP